MDGRRYTDGVALYPQPIEGGYNGAINNMEEQVGYLPGTSCRIWYTYLSTCYPEHWHRALEIIVGENGYYHAEAAGVSYEVHKGDILMIPHGVRHSLYPQKGCNGFVYLIDIRLLSDIRSAIAIVPERPIWITKKDHPKLHAAAIAQLGQMQKAYFSDNSMRELLIYSHLLALVAEIGRYQADFGGAAPQRSPCQRKGHAEIFNEVLYYISQHYMDALTIEGIAKQFGFSKFYFVRLFKQYTDFTFCDYLNDQRIKAAKHFLSQSDMPITRIAYQTGFSSISTFDRAFRKRIYCTPSEYRKDTRNS